MATSILLVLISFGVLAAAWYGRKYHRFHIAAMSAVVAFDVMFPFYLYLTHDWYTRLITHGDIFSFLIWMHLLFVMVLYALYGLQIMAGRAMLKHRMGEDFKYHREEHRKQFLGILAARLLVFASGAMLLIPSATN